MSSSLSTLENAADKAREVYEKLDLAIKSLEALPEFHRQYAAGPAYLGYLKRERELAYNHYQAVSKTWVQAEDYDHDRSDN